MAHRRQTGWRPRADIAVGQVSIEQQLPAGDSRTQRGGEFIVAGKAGELRPACVTRRWRASNGKSGRGQIVEGALLATALSFTNASLIEQAVIAANRVPTGNLGQTAAPVDIYRT